MDWELDHKESRAPNNWCSGTVVLEKTLESPFNCKEIKQSILKEISPKYSLKRLMLKLKLQSFGHPCKEPTHWERPWCWERLRTGGEGDNRGWDGGKASLTWWTWAWASFRSCWWTGKPDVLQSMGSQRVRHVWTPELNWTKVAKKRVQWIFWLTPWCPRLHISVNQSGYGHLQPGTSSGMILGHFSAGSLQKKASLHWDIVPGRGALFFSSDKDSLHPFPSQDHSEADRRARGQESWMVPLSGQPYPPHSLPDLWTPSDMR